MVYKINWEQITYVTAAKYHRNRYKLGRLMIFFELLSNSGNSNKQTVVTITAYRHFDTSGENW